MAKTESEIAVIEADSEWWERIGRVCGLGTLISFTRRDSAGFSLNGCYISVGGALTDVMTALADELECSRSSTGTRVDPA